MASALSRSRYHPSPRLGMGKRPSCGPAAGRGTALELELRVARNQGVVVVAEDHVRLASAFLQYEREADRAPRRVACRQVQATKGVLARRRPGENEARVAAVIAVLVKILALEDDLGCRRPGR